MYTSIISNKCIQLHLLKRLVCCTYKNVYIKIPGTAKQNAALSYPCSRHISTSGINLFNEGARKQKTQMMQHGYFNSKEKNRETFLDAINMFRTRERKLRGHVEFIYAALKHLEDYGVHRDLQVYKALLDIMPKGVMIPTNLWQQEFNHYPRHQECAMDVLLEMEINGVMPDSEVQNILINTFGSRGRAVKKFARMMYWMPKFKNSSPWPLPENLPDEAVELAELAMEQIGSIDPASEVTLMETADVEDSVDDTWIVSCMSPIQKELIAQLPKDEPVKVEGPFGMFLKDQRIAYFILRAEAKPSPPQFTRSEIDDVKNLFIFVNEEKRDSKELFLKRSVHEQDDGTILAMCATGTSSRDSVLSWIRLLEKTNPSLSSIPVLFTQSSPIGDVIIQDNADAEKEHLPTNATDDSLT